MNSYGTSWQDRFSEDLAAHRQKSGCPFWKGSGPVPGKEVEAAERVLFDRTDLRLVESARERERERALVLGL